MTPLATLQADAQALLDDPANQALTALYDPDAQPLRQHLSVAEETRLRNAEARSISGLDRIAEGLAQVQADLANPDIHDTVKADILVKLQVLVHGIP